MHQKAAKKVLDEKIKKIKDMAPLDYLNILNDKIKEKLIGFIQTSKFLMLLNNIFMKKKQRKEMVVMMMKMNLRKKKRLKKIK